LRPASARSWQSRLPCSFQGTARRKITGHCLDFDNPRSDRFVEVADRLKTRLKMQTAEEATAVLEELSRYGAGRTWMTATMAETVVRVQNEVAEALRERDYVVKQSDRGLWTVLDADPDAGAQPVAMADGGDTCVSCGESITHAVSGHDEKTNSCGCSVETDGGVTWYELHHFKRDTLRVAAEMTADGERMAGLDIKDELEKRYNTEIHHGRLYPNLDDLVEMDLLEKGTIDRRTNSYELTDVAIGMLRRQQETWENLELPKMAVADGGDA